MRLPISIARAVTNANRALFALGLSCAVMSATVLAQTPGAANSVDLKVTVTNTPQAGAVDQANDTYVPGGDVVYTVTVTNRGVPAVKGVVVARTVACECFQCAVDVCSQYRRALREYEWRR